MVESSNQGRPWTPQEDQLLVQAVAIYGEKERWKTIALHVPGRTNKACRKVRFSYASFSGMVFSDDAGMAL